MFSEVLMQVFGANLVDGADALFDVGAGALRCPRADAVYALLHGSVDKGVENVGAALKDALRAAADDDATACRIGLLDDFVGKSGHGAGVENVGFPERLAESRSHAAHGFFVDAAQP